MSEPLTDGQLAEIRKRGEMAGRESQQHRRDACSVSLGLLHLPCADVPLLLDEVERLRKESDLLAVRRNFGDLADEKQRSAHAFTDVEMDLISAEISRRLAHVTELEAEVQRLKELLKNAGVDV